MNHDWSVYRDPAIWPQSAGKVFLAEAVQRVGSAMFEEWDAELPIWLMHPDLPAVPAAYQAFDSNGNAVSSVHRAYGDAVRKIMSAGEFVELSMDDAARVRFADLDPESGEPTPYSLLRARRGEDRDDRITYDHWCHVSILSCHTREQQRCAPDYIRPVARAIQKAILEERIPIYIRPRGGSYNGAVPATGSIWEIDDPLLRLASCSFNDADVIDGRDSLTHWIFLDDAMLTAEIARLPMACLLNMSDDGPDNTEWARFIDVTNYFAANPDDIPIRGYNKICVKEITLLLRKEFIHQPQLQKMHYFDILCEKRGAPIPEGVWRLAWKKATKDFPEKARGGRPRNAARAAITRLG